MTKLLLIFFLGCLHSVAAQTSSRFVLEGGPVARATVLHYIGSNKIRFPKFYHFNAPYLFTRGVDGWGMNLATGYTISKKYSITIRETSTFRYAFYYFDPDKCARCVVRTLYWDQSLLLTKSAFMRRSYFGVGFTMFSIGKELEYNDNGVERVLPLHFNSLDLLVAHQIWKLHLEAKFSYVNHGFPGRVRRSAEIIGARLYYQFKFKKKTSKKP